MTDRRIDPEPPVFGHDPAPEHGAAFWANLKTGLGEEGAHGAPAGSPLPDTEPSHDGTGGHRRQWPLLVAAAAIVLVGLGALIMSTVDSGDGSVTDVASGPDDQIEGQVVPLDGPADGQDQPEPPGETGETGEPEERPILVSPGGSLPHVLDDAQFLATWEARRVSWFSVADKDGHCGDMAHSVIYYVRDDGPARPIRDPQLHFSGEIDHFVIDPELGRAAWLVSCETQLELYVAPLSPAGGVITADLVWLGEGQAANSLIIWVDDVVNLSVLGVDGSPYFVDYDFASGTLTGPGILEPSLDEAGQPDGRSVTPVGATADAELTYWNGADPDSESDCDGTSNTLWVRDKRGSTDSAIWREAVLENPNLGLVTAFALDDQAAQIAFADGCNGFDGRVFVGVQGADGLISNLREIDLSPFVPGFADELFWIDEDTLRIETDNRSHDVHPVRFDYILSDGVLVELN